MNFKDLYQKYQNGTCTKEEKLFVESEIEKASIVNDELLKTSKNIGIVPAEDKKIKMAYKQFNLKLLIKTTLISLGALIIATGIILGSIFGVAISNAKEHENYSKTKAKTLATNVAYEYAVDNLDFVGDKSSFKITHTDKDLEIRSPLKKSIYVYEFEIVFAGGEIEIEFNSKTGVSTISDVERNYR